MENSRVVITGLGFVTPIGTGKEKFWEAAVKGTCGVRPLKSIDTTDYKTKTGGEVIDFDPKKYLSTEEIDSMGRSSQMAIAAALEAVEDAKLDLSAENLFRVAVSMGTTMGEPQILDQCMQKKYAANGDSSAIPENLPRQYPAGVIPTNVARKLGTKGPTTIIPTACAAGNYAMGYAVDQIRLGKIDVAIAGGSDPFSSLAFTGFNRLLATTPDVPHPFSIDRNGMAVSEGAGMLIIESLEHAEARGAKIYAELVGYGATGDAFHMSQPAPNHEGAQRAMKAALKMAGITPDTIDYVNAHGTSTPFNDRNESIAIAKVFGDATKDLNISSTKSMTGHLLGASGGIELVACVKAMEESIIPPTINYSEKDPECADLNFTPNNAVEKEVNYAMSNSFGFGGHNASIIVKKYVA